MYYKHRYNLIRFDLSTTGTAYKLFIKSLYDYVIVKEVTVSDVTVRSYFIGAKDLEANWTDRASLTYSTDIKGRKLVNEGQNWLAAAGRTFTGLLDTYGGAAAAYSLQLLSTDYSGYCVTVRRASDNATLDIGFASNELDTATLEAFCSGTDGFVTTWYDQSGNGQNATQTTAASQPKIVSAGSVITQNGIASIDFDGTNYLQTANTGVDVSLEQTNIVAYNPNLITDMTPTQFLSGFYGTSGAEGVVHSSITGTLTGETLTIVNDGAAREAITENISAGWHLYNLDWNGTTHDISLDSIAGTYISTATPVQLNSRQITIGARPNITSFFTGKITALITFSADQTANKTGIETALNDYYNIY